MAYIAGDYGPWMATDGSGASFSTSPPSAMRDFGWA